MSRSKKKHPISDALRIMISAVSARIQATSLRGAAREVGLNPTGLNSLVKGASPYRKTREKLAVWYAKQSAGSNEDSRIVGLELLTRGIMNSELQARTRAVVLRLLHDLSPEVLSRLEEALAGEVVEGQQD